MTITSHIRLLFSSGDETSIEIALIGPNLCRLEQSLVFPVGDLELYWADVIEIVPTLQVDVWRFSQLIERGAYKHIQLLLAKEIIESAEFDTFLDTLVKIGGNGEVVFGGLLFAHIPITSSFDPEVQLSSIYEGLHKKG